MKIGSNMVRNAVERGLGIEEAPIVARYEELDTSTLNSGSHGMIVLGSMLRSIRTGHPLLYFGDGGIVMTILGIILGLNTIEQYVAHKALTFGPTLLAVMLTDLGVLFILAGLIPSAFSNMVHANRPRRGNGT